LIQDVIGVGGMGSVYRARDMHFPNVVKLVAVKEMINQAPDPVVRETIVQNFEREANILVTLSHPSIPRIFDYFSYDERSYLVEEYVQGRDLEAFLNDVQGFLPEEQVLGWALELCEVLNYLHSHRPEPIIFRDMKPSNVMINQHSHIVLVDFGIAKVFRSGQKGTMIGTEGYSPPEQYRGDATPLADIYALGATLHHLLTRRDPRLEAPFTFAERPVRKLNPAVSVELEAVINTALQYNPQDRFQSVEMMKEALLLTARKTGVLSKLGGVGGPASMPVYSGGEQGVKPLWTFECEDEVRGALWVEGGVAYAGAYDNNVYALNSTDGKFLWKCPTGGGIVGRPVIHEGTLYVGSEDKDLYAISARMGKVTWSYATDGPIRSSPKVAEGHVFVGSDDGYVHAVNLLSGRASWRTQATGPIRSTPYVTPEAIYVGCESGEVLCMDFRGQSRWRFRAKRAVTSSPIVHQGTVFFTSVDATFYAVDARSGWVIWRYRMGKGSISSPCIAEKTVFAGAADGYIYCLDIGSARELWRFQTDSQVSGSPLIYKDSLICGTADGKLYCIEYRSGRLRWQFSTGGPITSVPVVNNDVLYFGSADHIVYAIMP